MKGIRIISPGIHSTIQDNGRFGYREYGLPCSGVMDQYSFHEANILVGNPENTAVIESLFQGLEIEFLSSIIIAVTGGEAEIEIKGKRIKGWRSYRASRGNILRISNLLSGARTYLSLAGGFRIEAQLGSLSTYLPAGLGGNRGRELQKGDILPLYSPNLTFAGRKVTPEDRIPVFTSDTRLRVMKGIDAALFSKEYMEEFLQSEFTVSYQSDRMGIRLDSQSEVKIPSPQIISYGIHHGTIQIPPDGNPIIMGADCQTTGGYPQLANILSADLYKCGQLKPGDKVKFELTEQGSDSC